MLPPGWSPLNNNQLPSTKCKYPVWTTKPKSTVPLARKLLGMLELIVGWLYWTIKHANKWLVTSNCHFNAMFQPVCLTKHVVGETLQWSDNWKWQVICWRAWSSKIIILLSLYLTVTTKVGLCGRLLCVWLTVVNTGTLVSCCNQSDIIPCTYSMHSSVLTNPVAYCMYHVASTKYFYFQLFTAKYRYTNYSVL